MPSASTKPEPGNTKSETKDKKKYEQNIFNIENMCMYVHIIYIYIKRICVYYSIQNSYLKPSPRGAFESC